MVLVQKWPFFQVFFLGNIGQENVFYDILERKNDFLGLKTRSLITPRGLVDGFCQKRECFLIGILWRIKSKKSVFLYSG